MSDTNKRREESEDNLLATTQAQEKKTENQDLGHKSGAMDFVVPKDTSVTAQAPKKTEEQDLDPQLVGESVGSHNIIFTEHATGEATGERESEPAKVSKAVAEKRLEVAQNYEEYPLHFGRSGQILRGSFGWLVRI